MGYVDFSGQDDMQDDTYKIITGLILQAHMAYQQKDLSLYYTSIDGLYLLVSRRLGAEKAEEFEKKLTKAAVVIYNIQNATAEIDTLGMVMTSVMDDLRAIYKEILGKLDDMGILFKMRSDVSTIVTSKRGAH